MKYFVLLSFFSFTAFSYADQWVNGYRKKNGSYVQGHYRSNGNSTKAENWPTKGNVNPYTGKKGYKTYDNYNNGSYGNRGYGN